MELTSEQISQLAAMLMPELDGYSEHRYLVDGDADAYKPFYRATAILMGGGEDSWPAKLFGLDRVVSLGEAKAILTEAHPYFAEAIERDPASYVWVYDFHYDVWSDVMFWGGTVEGGTGG